MPAPSDELKATTRREAEGAAAERQELERRLRARLGHDWDPSSDEGRREAAEAIDDIVASDPSARGVAARFLEHYAAALGRR